MAKEPNLLSSLVPLASLRDALPELVTISAEELVRETARASLKIAADSALEVPSQIIKQVTYAALEKWLETVFDKKVTVQYISVEGTHFTSKPASYNVRIIGLLPEDLDFLGFRSHAPSMNQIDEKLEQNEATIGKSNPFGREFDSIVNLQDLLAIMKNRDETNAVAENIRTHIIEMHGARLQLVVQKILKWLEANSEELGPLLNMQEIIAREEGKTFSKRETLEEIATLLIRRQQHLDSGCHSLPLEKLDEIMSGADERAARKIHRSFSRRDWDGQNSQADDDSDLDPIRKILQKKIKECWQHESFINGLYRLVFEDSYSDQNTHPIVKHNSKKNLMQEAFKIGLTKIDLQQQSLMEGIYHLVLTDSSLGQSIRPTVETDDKKDLMRTAFKLALSHIDKEPYLKEKLEKLMAQKLGKAQSNYNPLLSRESNGSHAKKI